MMDRKGMLSTISDQTSEGRINCLIARCWESKAGACSHVGVGGGAGVTLGGVIYLQLLPVRPDLVQPASRTVHGPVAASQPASFGSGTAPSFQSSDLSFSLYI